jgi:hypothetical protein
MFADKIGEASTTTGTGTFAMGGAYGAFRTWRSGFSSGDAAFYLATNDTGTIWEIGYGIFTTGTPDTLTRTLQESSSGALIDWQTTPYRIYNAPNAAAAKHLLAALVNGVAAVPGWLPAGAMWLDFAIGVAVEWAKKRYISGTRTAAASHAEEGRFHLGLDAGATHIFAASQRKKFEDKGAASYTFTADDIGKVLAFDCSAAGRTLTMLAHDAAGMGHGAYVFVYPYGSTANGVTFTPGGADTTDLATAPPGRVTRFDWDGARSKWIADYVVPATEVIRSHLAGLGMSNNGGTPNTKIDVAAGQCADGTAAAMLAMSAGTIDCGTTGANGLDTGSLGASTWYHAFAIGKTDGTTAFLASTSASAPTMPSGYTLKRRIGSFKTDGSSHILAFTQDGDYFRWSAMVADFADTNPGTSAVSKTLSGVPSGVSVLALLLISATTGSNDFVGYISDPAASDEVPVRATGFHNFGGVNTGESAGAQMTVRTNTSAQVRYRISASGASDAVRCVTLGWTDRRGRDA